MCKLLWKFPFIGWCRVGKDVTSYNLSSPRTSASLPGLRTQYGADTRVGGKMSMTLDLAHANKGARVWSSFLQNKTWKWPFHVRSEQLGRAWAIITWKTSRQALENKYSKWSECKVISCWEENSLTKICGLEIPPSQQTNWKVWLWNMQKWSGSNKGGTTRGSTRCAQSSSMSSKQGGDSI